MTNHLERDHDQALADAIDRLVTDFAGTFNRETVERFVTASFEDLSSRAKTFTYVPLLSERFARQRLAAVARVDAPSDGKPTVLFLCVHNAGKSQMALGLFQKYAGDRAVAWSGGSEPGDSLNEHSVAAMAEIGIDITHEFPKPWTEEVLRAADVIVTMGCGDACPVYPGKRYLDWELDAPPAKSIENVRPVRDDIDRRVRGLLSDLGIDVTSETLTSAT